jgi:hypothetical protein
MVFAQTPPGHWVGRSVAHMVEQVPLLQTCAPMQALLHMPQLLVSCWTHWPLQNSSPAPHWHEPL